MSVHPQYAATRKSWGINGASLGNMLAVILLAKRPLALLAALGSVIVEVVADDGTTGVGVSIGGDPACFIVENHLSRFVEGQDPR
jgi:L-rhamnonate dehydratase